MLTLRVSINHIHRNREADILAYWSGLVGVSQNQFTKTSYVKSTSKKIYRNPEDHFGTLRVKVRRGTNLRRRVMGALHRLEDYIKNQELM